MQTLAIIQARMTSTRLPGKVLADIWGRPLLEHVCARARRARKLDLVVVATTDRPTDDRVAAFCSSAGIPCFRGNEDDVLDRYCRAARAFPGDAVVRLTADCPLLDPAVIDQVVAAFESGDYDYVSNTLTPTFPDGLDTEVFRREALERAWREARLKSEREHVTPFIWKHTDLFRTHCVRNVEDLSGLRWTVDTPEDLDFVRRLYRHFEPRLDFGMTDILDALARNPELSRRRASSERNEGYLKSLREDSRQNEA
jgi:spore coat polysaccharide biosynthesis protein SpsF (cytidylyltransferase family)